MITRKSAILEVQNANIGLPQIFATRKSKKWKFEEFFEDVRSVQSIDVFFASQHGSECVGSCVCGGGERGVSKQLQRITYFVYLPYRTWVRSMKGSEDATSWLSFFSTQIRRRIAWILSIASKWGKPLNSRSCGDGVWADETEEAEFGVVVEPGVRVWAMGVVNLLLSTFWTFEDMSEDFFSSDFSSLASLNSEAGVGVCDLFWGSFWSFVSEASLRAASNFGFLVSDNTSTNFRSSASAARVHNKWCSRKARRI